MKEKEIRALKLAVLTSAAALSFVAFAPSAEAEGAINDFSQAVYNEMQSNSEFMREARQYVSDARAAHETQGTSYSDFQDDAATAARYPELHAASSGRALNYITYALEQGETAQDAVNRGVMGKVRNQFLSDSELVGNLDTAASGTQGQFAVANGRITPGSSHVLGDQTVYGSLSAMNGIDANGQRITNVGNGEVSENSKDAVNGGQLYEVSNAINQINQQYNSFGDEIGALNRRVGRLDNKINRVGAGAAALAALNPLPYNPNQKWSVATGYGHYHNANASALGAYYSPNENVMVSLGSVVGNGENMVNAGVSVRLGPSSNKPMNNTSVSADVEALKSLVLAQGNQIQEQGNQLQEQSRKIETLEKQNAELLAKLEQSQS